jgi:hypothetical protein
MRRSLIIAAVWCGAGGGCPPASLGKDPVLAREGAAATADLEARAGRAIAAGKEALRRRFADLVKTDYHDYPLGRIALPLAALLKSGLAADDPLATAAFARLRGLPLEKTYCVACYLFALDALARRRSEEARGGDGRSAAVSPPHPSLDEADLRRLEECVAWLVAAQLPEHGSWTYERPGKAARHDFSNTQFAVLGLQIGLDHGIDVPAEVFARVAGLFARSVTRDRREDDLELTLATGLEEKFLKTRVVPVRRVRLAAGGWGYTDPRRGGGRRPVPAKDRDPEDGERMGREPYASMTAAGASCLSIALRALGREPGGARVEAAPAARGKPARRASADPALLAEAERAFLAAAAWIARHFDLFLADDRHVFYTLYSLEKVGDLARIEAFGGRDWYREGAERLLGRQRADGGWGTYIDTSFALLFLTRATRPFAAGAAPAIYTGGGEPAGAGGGDLVFIERLGGFVSARAILGYLLEARRPELAELGAEVVRHYPPGRREELVPQLIAALAVPGAIGAFARRSLAEITGVEGGKPEAYETWLQELAAVRGLEGKEAPAAAEVAALLQKTSNTVLKARLAALAARRGLRSLAEILIAELASARDSRYRSQVHGALKLLTGAAVQAPPRDDGAAWDATAAAWEAWWRAEGRATLEGPAAQPSAARPADGCGAM